MLTSNSHEQPMINTGKNILVLLCLFVFSQAAFSQENKDKWVDLFDGKSIEQWVKRGGNATYRVENGEIEVEAMLGGKEYELYVSADGKILEIEAEDD